MNEKKSKRREWIKTAAIIFLSVLLVLTFFSNTIMNYSLPEVATQYVEPGTITAKIRGTGIVESGDPYSVKLKNSNDAAATGEYKVESVEVKKGDNVEKGAVLCRLEEGSNKELEAKRTELKQLILDMEIAIVNGDYSSSVLAHAQSGNVSNVNAYQSQIAAKEDEIRILNEELQEAKDTLLVWQNQKGEPVNTNKEKKKLEEAQAAYDEVADAVDAAKNAISEWQKEIEANNALIQDYLDKKQMVDGNGNLVPAVTQEQYNAAVANNGILKARIEAKRKEIATDEAKLPDLKKALDKAQRAYDNKASSTESNVNDQITIWTKETESRQRKVDDAEKEKQQMIRDFAQELKLSDQIAKIQKEIDALEGENVDGEVTAPISGTIIAVNVKSGTETPTDGVLFEMQPEGKGYTMQFSVTNEQAKRLSVGDRADLVNSWRYSDVDVVLDNIKPDPMNPSKNKLLTFNIEGDVAEGQSLSVSVGQKSANYDLIVPNSAIREDNNGKFILTVETKSTPLSNRYIAVRVDVEVLANDDTRSAISAPLYGYEYVITTATAPVEAGKYIRLANNEG